MCGYEWVSETERVTKCGKNAETYTYQLQHVLILWHDGELQYTLTAKTTREHEIQQEYLQFIGLTVTMEQTLH